MSTLGDDLIAVAERAPKSLPPIRQQFLFIAEKIKRAQRFLVMPEARWAIRSVLTGKPSTLRPALAFASLPYPVCWFEWVPPPDASPVLPGQSRIKKCGALVEQIGGPREASVFTAWRFYDDVDHLQDERLDRHPEFREISSYGVSSIQGGFDFSNFDRPPSMLARPGWTARKLLAEDRDALALARNDVKNSVKWALNSEIEREALVAIERRCVYRVLEEIGGYELLHLAGRVGGNEYISSAIQDVAGEIGHLIATLILMNSKNCVELKTIEPPAKLNKARRKAGKTELLPYSTVEITLNRPAARAAASASESEREAMRRHLVRGHFKVRKTGVFWWHAFLRGDESKGTIERKTHIVTAET